MGPIYCRSQRNVRPSVDVLALKAMVRMDYSLDNGRYGVYTSLMPGIQSIIPGKLGVKQPISDARDELLKLSTPFPLVDMYRRSDPQKLAFGSNSSQIMLAISPQVLPPQETSIAHPKLPTRAEVILIVSAAPPNLGSVSPMTTRASSRLHTGIVQIVKQLI